VGSGFIDDLAGAGFTGVKLAGDKVADDFVNAVSTFV
jgi:hypothetical protein